MKKLFIFFLPISFLWLPFTIFITSCSSTNNSQKQLIEYKHTQESINEIGNDVESSDFSCDRNLLLTNVTNNDIKWKYASNYSDLEMIINIQSKKNSDLIDGKEVTNIVYFSFSLRDSKKNFVFNSKYKYFMWGFK